MNKTLGILFYLKTAKTNQTTGQAPIYLRITVDGARNELSIKREIRPERWNPEAGKSKGTNEQSRALNAHIDLLRSKVQEHQHNLIKNDQPVTSLSIKNSLLGVNDKGKMLTELMDYHNIHMKALIGKDYTNSTYQRYVISTKHVLTFLKWKYQLTDIPIKQIDHQFVTEYDFYLRTERNIANNATVKYLRNFNKVIRIALANGWMERNPFLNFKVKLKEVEKHFLTKGELHNLINKDLNIDRLRLVRDIFVFSCFTGLAYADVAKLSNDDIVKGIDGEDWININRTKTDVKSKIPLLEEAKVILKKYNNNPVCLSANKLLPILSNQKMNAYLKEIADVCGINKCLTFHIARHTFATTVTLVNNVPIESVSKMLGHKTITMTQHYAKILDRKLSDDMLKLKSSLA